MRKATRIVGLVNAILLFVVMLGLIIGATVCFIVGNLPAILEEVGNHVEAGSEITPEQAKLAYQLSMNLTAGSLIFGAAWLVPGAILSLSIKKDTDGEYDRANKTSMIIKGVFAVVFGAEYAGACEIVYACIGDRGSKKEPETVEVKSEVVD